MKKLIFIIVLSTFLIGCSANVTVNAVESSGGPVPSAIIVFTDENGGTYQTNTGPSGEAQVNLEYGTYKAEATKEGYSKASHSNIEVTLIGAIFGIQADMTLSKNETE